MTHESYEVINSVLDNLILLAQMDSGSNWPKNLLWSEDPPFNNLELKPEQIVLLGKLALKELDSQHWKDVNLNTKFLQCRTPRELIHFLNSFLMIS